jgi:hypothetical protein
LAITRQSYEEIYLFSFSPRVRGNPLGRCCRFSQAREENSRLTHILLRLIAMAGACLWLPSGEQIARATTISANVDSTRVVRLGDKGYRYVEGSLNGTIARGGGSSGSYSAGFVLYYPTESN